MINPFATFRKIDAHSHIGMFGAPFNVNFNAERKCFPRKWRNTI